MSPTLRFVLRVQVPEQLDAETAAEIAGSAEPHDRTIADKVERWLGGALERTADELNDHLPDGWYTRVDGRLQPRDCERDELERLADQLP